MRQLCVRSLLRSLARHLPVVASAWIVLFAAELPAGARTDPAAVAAVAWPISAGLVISEIQTGGQGASDEFVELYNAGTTDADLLGLEVAYVSSSGGTVTRKASWTGSLAMGPGRHLLLANSAGAFASIADGTYVGGLAATGGAIVLRPAGGAPIDAIGWGDATSTFVEGAACPAPAAGSSVERLPGGLLGNAVDTNDNLADLRIQASPTPQSLAAPPVPAPQPSPTAEEPTTPLASPSPSTEPSVSPPASVAPTVAPSPTPEPSVVPTAIPTATATAAPSATPTPTASATPPPTATPAPSPTAAATPVEPIAVAAARGLADGTPVAVAGTMTTPAGFLESGHQAFLQDGTAGIALYLAGTDWPGIAQGGGANVMGTLDTRYAQRIIRIASGADVVATDPPIAPAPLPIATGSGHEADEGTLVVVTGEVQGGATVLADGFSVDLDDGSGALRIVAVTATGLIPASLPAHVRFRITGVLGQRDSTGSGSSGYRLYARDAADVDRLADPTPTPTPGAEATPTPVPTATPAPGFSATPGPSSSPSMGSIEVAAARGMPVGSAVRVTGVVTAEPGSVIGATLFAVQDTTGGIAIRLDRARAGLVLPRGQLVAVEGVLADPYGNLEIRLASSSRLDVLGPANVPDTVAVTSTGVAETNEGRLVRASGKVVEVSHSSTGAATLVLEDQAGRFRVAVNAPAVTSALVKCASFAVIGILVQRASARDRPDGYRIWTRDGADLLSIAGPTPSPSPGPSPTPTPSPGSTSTASATPTPAAFDPIGRVRDRTGVHAEIDGIVTAAPGSIDGDLRRVVMEDATGAILVRLTAEGPVVREGDRLQVGGKIGTYRGAPQLAGDQDAVIVDRSQAVRPTVLRSAAKPPDEWRLVQVTGLVTVVHRYGASWRAELRLPGGATLPVQAGSRSGIPSTSLIAGRSATVVGIVRRPSATAHDRRLGVWPRSTHDITMASAPAAGPTPAPAAGGSMSRSGGTTGAQSGSGLSQAVPGSQDGVVVEQPLDVDLAELADHTGELVRVGGLVASVSAASFELDDGTATAAVHVTGDGIALLDLITPGETVNVTGRAAAGQAGDTIVFAASATAIARVGSLGEFQPLGSTAASAAERLSGQEESAVDIASPSAVPPAGGRPNRAPVIAGAGVAVVVAVSLGMSLALLRRRRILAERMFEARVRRRLDACAPAAPASPPGEPI
jgi:DNA/RNA endonuclease YhcR with UshA esterase domain